MDETLNAILPTGVPSTFGERQSRYQALWGFLKSVNALKKQL
jgi:hypothetical protein